MLFRSALLLLGPVGEAVVAVVNRLISESLRPTRLPRLALAEGLPPEERVLVIMPCMLTSPAGIEALCAQLEQHAVANPVAGAQFALLSDWADADAAEREGDAAGHARVGRPRRACDAVAPLEDEEPVQQRIDRRDERRRDDRYAGTRDAVEETEQRSEEHTSELQSH